MIRLIFAGALGTLFVMSVMTPTQVGHAQSTGSAEAGARTSDATKAGTATLFTSEQIEALVTPFAGYSQRTFQAIILASQTPASVIEAARLLSAGSATKAEVQALPKSLQYLLLKDPAPIRTMYEDLKGLAQLGKAYQVQPNDVWIAVGTVSARTAPSDGSPARPNQQEQLAASAQQPRGDRAPEQEGDANEPPKSETEAAVSRATVTTSMVRRTQDSLTRLGYDPGPVDGIMGQKTVFAIRQYESDAGLPVTGEVTPTLLAGLEKKAASSSSGSNASTVSSQTVIVQQPSATAAAQATPVAAPAPPPQYVYVQQPAPQPVYVEDNSADAAAAGLIGFGLGAMTGILIEDDDDFDFDDDDFDDFLDSRQDIAEEHQEFRKSASAERADLREERLNQRTETRNTNVEGRGQNQDARREQQTQRQGERASTQQGRQDTRQQQQGTRQTTTQDRRSQQQQSSQKRARTSGASSWGSFSYTPQQRAGPRQQRGRAYGQTARQNWGGFGSGRGGGGRGRRR